MGEQIGKQGGMVDAHGYRIVRYKPMAEVSVFLIIRVTHLSAYTLAVQLLPVVKKNKMIQSDFT